MPCLKNIIIIILIGLTHPCLALPQGQQGPSCAQITSQYETRHALKLEFFLLDKNTGERIKSVGFAELKEEKLFYRVEDSRLEKLLKGDFHTVVTSKEGGRQVERLIVYKSGTVEHLCSVASHCPQIGCVAEIVPL